MTLVVGDRLGKTEVHCQVKAAAIVRFNVVLSGIGVLEPMLVSKSECLSAVIFRFVHEFFAAGRALPKIHNVWQQYRRYLYMMGKTSRAISSPSMIDR